MFGAVRGVAEADAAAVTGRRFQREAEMAGSSNEGCGKRKSRPPCHATTDLLCLTAPMRMMSSA